MPDRLVIVNGLPGAGKSTLARQLGSELGCPALIKDDLKESFADRLGAADTTVSRPLGALASDLLWDLAALVDDLVVVESFWPGRRDRPYVVDGLARVGARAAVEVWCRVPFELAQSRYLARRRHPIHPAGLEDDWNGWQDVAPLALTPVVEVDTTAPVDVPAVARRILDVLGSP